MPILCKHLNMLFNIAKKIELFTHDDIVLCTSSSNFFLFLLTKILSVY